MKKSIIIALAVLLVCLSACGKEAEYTLKEYSQDTIFIKQQDKVYDFDDIITEIDKTDDFFSFCEDLEIKKIKSIMGDQYTVIKSTDGFYHLLSDAEGKAILRKIEFSPIDHYDALSEIRVGMTVEDVQIADVDGSYDYLYANWSQFPKYSYHYFESGNCFYIRYADEVITSIVEFTI